MSRISARENLMKLVFSYNFNKEECDFDELLAEENLTEDDKNFILNNFNGIKINIDDIVKLIENNLVNYKLERICKTDLAILIVAIYEIKYENAPKKVVINEAVELSKKYSTEKSYSFVNGVLAKVVK